MTCSLIKLPYFDFLLTQFSDGNANIEKAFGRHVHWGYWENPETADGTVEDFAQATEALSNMITDKDYGAIAKQAGLSPCFEQDITAETMPTYEILSSMTKTGGIESLVANWVNQATASAQGSRNILYKVLAYEKLG